MAETAKLGAGQLVSPWFCRLEPADNLAPRYDVLLKPHVRNKETMDDVRRGHHQANRLIGRDMQVVIEFDVVIGAELFIRARIIHFPVELLGDDTQFKIRRRHMALYFCPTRSAHEREYNQDNGGNDSQYDFQRGI